MRRSALAVVGLVLTFTAASLVLLVQQKKWVLQQGQVTRKQPPFSSAPSSSFNGTFVVQRNGSLLYRHVCLQLNESGFHLITYSLSGEPIVSPEDNVTRPIPDVPADRKFPDTWLVGKTLQQWGVDRETFFVKDTTVLLDHIYGSNIAHCTCDEIFSLAPDLPQSWNSSGLYYPNFIYVDLTNKELLRSCTTWCCKAFHYAGIIGRDASPIYRKEIDRDGVPVCFERLVVPRFGAHRRPPINVVKNARDALMHSTGLVSAEWQHDPAQDISILFYDRQGSRRRIWNNSKQVKTLLERDYHASVRVIGNEWNKLNFSEQALLFNSYPVIVAPHGAHLANLMFAREGTTVFELLCSKGDGEYCPSQDWKPSFYTFSWYPSFSRSIPLQHFQIPEFEGCLVDGKFSGYSPELFSVNITSFLPCLVSRLELKKREKSS